MLLVLRVVKRSCVHVFLAKKYIDYYTILVLLAVVPARRLEYIFGTI